MKRRRSIPTILTNTLQFVVGDRNTRIICENKRFQCKFSTSSLTIPIKSPAGGKNHSAKGITHNSKNIIIDFPSTLEKVDSWIDAHITLKNIDAIGFDLEYKPSTVTGHLNKTALIQIATLDSIMLAHLPTFDYEFPSKLKTLMNNPLCKKVGVGIYSDLQKLQLDYSIPFCSHVEIGKAIFRH